jgi:hypothetical protein
MSGLSHKSWWPTIAPVVAVAPGVVVARICIISFVTM